MSDALLAILTEQVWGAVSKHSAFASLPVFAESDTFPYRDINEQELLSSERGWMKGATPATLPSISVSRISRVCKLVHTLTNTS